MASNLPTIMVRTQKEVIDKLKVISKENGRSMSKEVETLIKNHIRKYEIDNGEIQVEEQGSKTVNIGRDNVGTINM